MTAANVVEGKADLAFTMISEILPIAGVELGGPLPAEIQTYVVFYVRHRRGHQVVVERRCLFLAVRPEGGDHQWRKIPPESCRLIW